jgi:hypothetical protein
MMIVLAALILLAPLLALVAAAADTLRSFFARRSL